MSEEKIKKELATRYTGMASTLVEIYYVGGGQVPKILSGKYTSPATAEKAITLYLKKER